MNLICELGNVGITFLIVIGILFVGALSYYFNSRIINLEKTIVKQNHVLTDFISNVKNNTMARCIKESACPEVIVETRDVSEKIGVSDNESSKNSDTESVPDSDSDSDSDSETSTTKFDVSLMNGVVQLSAFEQLTTSPIIVEIEDTEQPNTIKLGDLDNVEQLDNISVSNKSLSQEDSESCTITSTGNSMDFKNMKLSQLKDIASSKGIDVKGKKKNDLVESLNKH
jgi:hypothetical protein